MPVEMVGSGEGERRGVEQVDVQDVKEERDAAVGFDDGASAGEPLPGDRGVEDGVQEQVDAEGGEEIVQGRRILLYLEERHRGLCGGGEVLEGVMVAVAVEQAEKGEDEKKRGAEKSGQALAACGVEEGKRAERVAEADDADPGDEGVGDGAKDPAADEDETLFVDEFPEEGVAPKGCGLDGVEEVVEEDDERAEDTDRAGGKALEQAEKDHADADRPDDLEDGGEGERPAEIDDGDFEKHEPEAAGDEQLRGLRRGFTALTLEVDGRAGESDEGRGRRDG